jgi:hypothetical protein
LRKGKGSLARQEESPCIPFTNGFADMLEASPVHAAFIRRGRMVITGDMKQAVRNEVVRIGSVPRPVHGNIYLSKLVERKGNDVRGTILVKKSTV